MDSSSLAIGKGKMYAIWQVQCAESDCRAHNLLTFNHSASNAVVLDARLAQLRDSRGWPSFHSPKQVAEELGWRKRVGKWYCPTHAKKGKR